MLNRVSRGELHTLEKLHKFRLTLCLTDAISVACKALGIAADVYFDRDPDSKYPTQPQQHEPHTTQRTIPVMTYEMALHYVMPNGKHQGKTMAEIFKTDISYINELGASPDTGAEILTAINLICAEIKKAREAKLNAFCNLQLQPMVAQEILVWSCVFLQPALKPR